MNSPVNSSVQSIPMHHHLSSIHLSTHITLFLLPPAPHFKPVEYSMIILPVLPLPPYQGIDFLLSIKSDITHSLSRRGGGGRDGKGRGEEGARDGSRAMVSAVPSTNPHHHHHNIKPSLPDNNSTPSRSPVNSIVVKPTPPTLSINLSLLNATFPSPQPALGYPQQHLLGPPFWLPCNRRGGWGRVGRKVGLAWGGRMLTPSCE